jgi:sugar phosphate permease
MRYVVLLLICLAAIIAYIQRTALTVPTKTIQPRSRHHRKRHGLIMACWFWGYAVLQVPAGLIVDRIGSKRGLLVFVVAWSLLTGFAAIATGFPELLVLWSLMGLAQTGLVPGAAKGIGNWFSPTGRAFASGILGASMALGGAIAPLIAAYLLEWVPWRQLLGLYVLPGLVWAFSFALIVPGRHGSRAKPAPFLDTIGRMAANRRCCFSVPSSSFASAMALFFTWFPRFP